MLWWVCFLQIGAGLKWLMLCIKVGVTPHCDMYSYAVYL